MSLFSARSPIFFHLWMVPGNFNESVLITQGRLPGERPSVGQIPKLLQDPPYSLNLSGSD